MTVAATAPFDPLTLLPALEQLPAKLPRNGMTARVHRSLLKNAPYNPRSLDAYAAAGLADNIARTGGLVDDPIWNRRTGFLVSGHQRLTQEDKRRGTVDYWLSVKVVDWDEKTEREQNVALNNPAIQGQYDIAKLDELLKRPDINYLNTGFGAVDMEEMYANAGVKFDFAAIAYKQPAGTGTDLDAGRENAESAAAEVADTIDESTAARERERERLAVEAEMKERKAAMKNEQAFQNDIYHYVSLVFPNTTLKAAFMRFIGKPEPDMQIDGIAVCKFLGIEVPEFQEFFKSRDVKVTELEPPTTTESEGTEDEFDI
jgi:hypothetical protein